MTFVDAVLNTTVEARTLNGMKAIESTLSSCVDLFFKIGSSRGKNITPDFEKAYQENKDFALRILLWARDIRSGAGEREIFRQVLSYLEKNHKKDLLDTNLLDKIPDLGRWDDMFTFTQPEIRAKAFDIYKNALDNGNGLAAKWAPRKGADAIAFRSYLGWSPKFYRKTIVNLTKVVETQMCAKEFESINFSHVPSLAMTRYNKAFAKNAPVAYYAYKNALSSGDKSVKVNAGAVYPYDVIKSINHGNGDNIVADEQWNSLPNYIGDASIIPVVDVSGSMGVPAGKNKNLTCLDVSLSLGLYCSDKNTGPFKDLFLTFSSNSKFELLKGTLSQKLNQLKRGDWSQDTNIGSAFTEILRVATKNSVSPESMPKAILILSDMQFNECARYDDSAMEMIRRKYEESGYKVPAIIFWNLNSHDNVPVQFNEKGAALVSGFSPAIMKSVLNCDLDNISPVSIMKDTIMNDRYTLSNV